MLGVDRRTTLVYKVRPRASRGLLFEGGDKWRGGGLTARSHSSIKCVPALVAGCSFKKGAVAGQDRVGSRQGA